RGRGEPRRDGRLPAQRAPRTGAGDEVHALPGDTVLRHGPPARRLRRGLGAHERHELGVRAARAHGRGAGALLPARLPRLLHASRRAVGARPDARRRAALPPPARRLRARRRGGLALRRARPVGARFVSRGWATPSRRCFGTTGRRPGRGTTWGWWAAHG